MNSIPDLYKQMCTPSEALLEDFQQIEGDILILGAGGKMGPTLAMLAQHATDQLMGANRVIAVSRFSDKQAQAELEAAGITTISADLLNENDLAALPDAPNVIFMAGMKFGASSNPGLTWAMNTWLPACVARRYPNSRIVAFSTGNVYPLTPISEGGPDESIQPDPIGEYAQSCLGRERMFEYFSYKNQTPALIFRLNYAIDMRYGVLLEVAKAVFHESPIDLSMSHVNVIWQGDANEYALRSLLHTSSPPKILNVSGPETLSIQWLAAQFGKAFGKAPIFTGQAQPTALLTNASTAHQLFGYPKVSLRQMIDWTAEWVSSGGTEFGKPTKFQQRKGDF